ncbi:MAG: acyl-CoA desaturase [Planctomycetes bacterium]|nr:acyl-CoA desaturase [Planctomycetota bacterium]
MSNHEQVTDPLQCGISLERDAANSKRIANLISIGIPLVGTAYAPLHFRHYSIGWIALSSFVLFYIAIGIGIGLGFHRYLTHKSFLPVRWLKWTLLVLGSFAFQGPVIRWIADHRRHHRFSDHPWDTHSPLFNELHPIHSKFRGLWHAHVGWMFDRTTTDYRVYAPDLLRDRDCVLLEHLYPLWMFLSLALPWLYGFLLGGADVAWSCLILGGCVRTTVFHNVVWGVNSIGHIFGSRDATKRDSSRNNLLLALATFGEGWHNNHHAAPRCAYNRWKWYQIDLNGILIWCLGKSGLVKDIVSTHNVVGLPSDTCAPLDAAEVTTANDAVL